MNASSDPLWPSELRCSADKKYLSIRFENGDNFTLSAELLRVESPSAEVQGHGSDQKKTPLNKGDVQILGIEPVGSYAVRLIFINRFAWMSEGEWATCLDLNEVEETICAKGD